MAPLLVTAQEIPTISVYPVPTRINRIRFTARPLPRQCNIICWILRTCKLRGSLLRATLNLHFSEMIVEPIVPVHDPNSFGETEHVQAWLRHAERVEELNCEIVADVVRLGIDLQRR